MGIYRLILSLAVVMYHFGAWPPLSGHVAVFGFFCVSGYLMALVIDRAYGYDPLGAARFLLNRALRLVPVFAVYVALTYLLLRFRDFQGFFIDPNEPMLRLVSIAPPLGTGASLTIQNSALPLVAGGVSAIPQAWSLVVEAVFYVSAPLLAFLARRAWPVFAAIALGSVAINVITLARGLDFENYVYQNFLGALWVFMLGMTIYYRRSLWERIPGKKWIALAGLVAIEWLMGFYRQGDLHVFFYVGVAIAAVLTATLGSITTFTRRLRPLERYAGDLAYGIFLNHFLAAMLVLEANELALEWRGSFDALGRPNTTGFGIATAIVAVLLSAATFAVVEKPLQRSRDRIRGVPLSPSPAVPEPALQTVAEPAKV